MPIRIGHSESKRTSTKACWMPATVLLDQAVLGKLKTRPASRYGDFGADTSYLAKLYHQVATFIGPLKGTLEKKHPVQALVMESLG